MNKTNEKQLCWNCDGYVSILLSSCPYCGVFLKDPSMIDDDAPIFGPNDVRLAEEKGFLFPKSAPLFQSLEQKKAFKKNIIESDTEEIQKIQKESLLSKGLSVALIFIGAGFFVFSIFMLLFSHEHELVLRWNVHALWYYVPLSAAMLYLGYRLYGEKEEDGPSSDNSL
ncbi:hypothetical protein [Candidatus Clavichlamydia salmonicola]|uniref:hypothetical protein n=1 Tax=Candidatus Clavichlamydia salmonicola TaxID=469812 RepID=UPI0018916579|nr:hypothetical protein [Candidatus Clavichlamydia salmonicola]